MINMFKRLLTIVICFLLIKAYGQDNPNQPWLKNIPKTTYEVIEDDPSFLSRLSINFDFLYTMIAFKNISGSGVDMGFSGTYRPTPNLEWNALVHAGILSFDEPSSFMIDANNVLYLSSKTIKREVDVLLKYSKSTVGSYDYISTTSLSVPDRQVLKKFGFRAGVYLRRNAFEFESALSPMTQTGIYGGIQVLNATNVVIKVNGVEHFNESGFIYYADLLALRTGITDDAVKENYKNQNGSILPIGFRFGAIYRPLRPRSISRRDNFFANLELRCEAGWRPVEGNFFHTGAGWNFYRK